VNAIEIIGTEEKAEDDEREAKNVEKILKQNPYFRKIKKF